MTLESRIYDGNRAKEVLENEVFQQVWADLENGLIESWKNLPASESNQAGRERLHLSVTLLGKIKATIEQTLESGKLAALDVEHLEKKRLSQRLGLPSWKL